MSPAPFLRRARERLLRLPGLRIALQAFVNYIQHQSANQAGSVAFSAVLAMFPMVLLLSFVAGHIGEPGTAAELVRRLLSFAPAVAAGAVQPAVEQLLREPNRALLSIGLFVTVWTASSGTLAVRTALNKAYGVDQGLPFWAARVKVTLFTLIGMLGTVFAFSSVVIVPYLTQLIEPGPLAPGLRAGVRLSLAFAVLLATYATFYAWLTDLPQRFSTVMPGALVGALLWLAAATALSATLRSVGKLALVYGSFTGIVATLVFLYATAATLIFGAEINGAIQQARARATPARA